MAEPTVQVPVSLIERVLENGLSTSSVAELRALLSQPGPSAEPCTCPPPATHLGEGPDQDCPNHGDRLPADPRSIADMAPGTKVAVELVWEIRRAANGETFLVHAHEGFAQWTLPGNIDPSTIRDVTPPKEQS